jgi:radical SAM superfamily enzyme YgiQ (UPF0313 family)
MKPRFNVLLVKPSKYDDDGYIIRWWRGVITSNSLACLNALTEQVKQVHPLGQRVELVIHCIDETVEKVRVRELTKQFQTAGERAIACMVGVQTNQFARAFDLCQEFMKAGLPTMIGGFHVSGVMEMLPERTPELQQAVDAGITLVGGEVENRWGELLEAAYEERLEPVYNYVEDKPDLVGVPGPVLPEKNVDLFFNQQTSFDAGRGCPFKCSFCTIINIQGNTMRGRAADDIERLIRHNHSFERRHIFITDDNFARHKEWESIADRLIELREKENIRCSLMIQTDTLAHKIPRFIEKMTRAGCRRVFIGLETVNEANLIATGKRQNRLSEYRAMLQKWRDHGAITFAGYIIGFPGDTYESIMRDVDYLKHEIPVDLAEFFIMTPLPGSKDHQKLYNDGIAMDPDTNKYDSWHVVTKHPKMSDEDLMRAYRDCWKSFYSKEHMQTLLLRRKGSRRRLLFSALIWFCSNVFLVDAHPLIGGFVRRKGRLDRRPGFRRESFIPYYFRRVVESLTYGVQLAKMSWEIWRMTKFASRPENEDYMDDATTPEPVMKEVKRPKPAPVASVHA